MPSGKVLECAKAIAKRKLTIGFAESATAGRLTSEFALTPESGKILLGGIVSYDADLKQQILHVPKQLIDQFTPESAEVTEAITRGLQSLIPSDIYAGVTGLTTPGGSETPEKPVGTMFIHVIISGKSRSDRQVYKGSPEEIILQAIDRVAEIIKAEVNIPQIV